MIEMVNITVTEEGFKDQRELAQYLDVGGRSIIPTTVQMIAMVNKSVSESQSVALQKATGHPKRTKETGLGFVKLNTLLVRIVVLLDDPFGNNDGMKSQFAYAVLVANRTLRVSIVHHGSARRFGVSRSVMGTVVHEHLYAKN